MKRMKWTGTLLVFLALALNAHATTAPVLLGTASTFAVLAGTGVTNTGATAITGNVGSSPTPAIVGLLASQVTGTLYTTSNAVTSAAQGDLTTAYVTAAGESCANNLTGQDLGTVGSLTGDGGYNVYCFSSSAGLTGTLTLTGGPSDVFIFQIGSALTTATNSKVVLNGVLPCNVFWQVGSSATIGVDSDFVGTILALTSITLNGGNLDGRALARNGAVTISAAETITTACGAASASSIVLSPLNSSIVCGANPSSIIQNAAVSVGGVLVGAGTSVTFTITAGPDTGRTEVGITNSAGIATVTFPGPFSSTCSPDTITASLTGNAGVVSNTSTVTFVPLPPGSTTTSFCKKAAAPVVSYVTLTGPPAEVVLSVLASGGLSTVKVTTTNATSFVPPFDIGTTLTLTGITAIKTNQSESAEVTLTATDLCNHSTVFDPLVATITIPGSNSHAEEVVHFNGITPGEGAVLLQNGTHGVNSLVISVNRSEFKTELSDGETKTLDIASALYKGDNTITVTAFGKPNSSVVLTIAGK